MKALYNALQPKQQVAGLLKHLDHQRQKKGPA
jgi:hypothetical protein